MDESSDKLKLYSVFTINEDTSETDEKRYFIARHDEEAARLFASAHVEGMAEGCEVVIQFIPTPLREYA